MHYNLKSVYYNVEAALFIIIIIIIIIYADDEIENHRHIHRSYGRIKKMSGFKKRVK